MLRKRRTGAQVTSARQKSAECCGKLPGEAAFMLLRWRKVASTPLLTSDYKLWHVTYIGAPTRREVPCNSGAAVGCGPCAIGTDGGPLDPAGGAAIADDFGFTDSPNPFGVGDSPGGVASD